MKSVLFKTMTIMSLIIKVHCIMLPNQSVPKNSDMIDHGDPISDCVCGNVTGTFCFGHENENQSSNETLFGRCHARALYKCNGYKQKAIFINFCPTECNSFGPGHDYCYESDPGSAFKQKNFILINLFFLILYFLIENYLMNNML